MKFGWSRVSRRGFAGYGKLDPDISFKKLRAMVEGAALASKRLW